MTLRNKLLIGGVLVLFIGLIILLFNLPPSNSETLTIPVKVAVGNHSGFNIETSYLEFGMLVPGTNGIRNVTLTNGGQRKDVTVSWSGSIKNWISSDTKYFILEPNQTSNIQFVLEVPSTAKQGNYSGQVRIVLRVI